MRIGAIYPQQELTPDPASAAAFARGVEELGYDHILCYDHVLGSPADRQPPLTGPYTHEDSFHDPLMLFAFLAGVTRSIELATGVLVLPQRQTALVARQAADLDLLSGGRLRLGVSIGWNYVEYDALGQDFTSRAPRIVEQIELLRQLWSGDVVEFEGLWDRVDRAALNPSPGRLIPVWLGGGNHRALERAIAVGDGFIFGAKPALEIQPMLDSLRDGLRAAGRDPEHFGTDFIVGGTGADSLARELADWDRLGGTHASVLTMYKGLGSDVAPHLALLADVKQRLVGMGLWH